MAAPIARGPAAPAPRVVRMLGDSMEPTLRSGDMVLAVPVSGFRYDGLYVLSLLGWDVDIFRCQSVGTGIKLLKDNKGYGPRPVVSVEDFAEMVLAQVAATGTVIAPELLRANG